MEDYKKHIHICEYCDKKFSTKHNLSRHQQTAVLCLELQKNPKYRRFGCIFCGNSYTTKNNLSKHILKCKCKHEFDNKEKIKAIEKIHQNKVDQMKKDIFRLREDRKKLRTELREQNENMEKEISKLRKDKKKLKDELKVKDEEIITLRISCSSSKADGKLEVYDKVCNKVIDQPKIANTTNYIHPKLANLPITTIHPLTIDYVKERVDNGDYTFDHYLKGPYGIVEFIQDIATCKNADGEIERNYPCTDASRERFHRLIETREWQKDTGGGFIDDIIDSVRGPVDKYHKQMLQERLENKEYDRTKGYDADEIFKKNDEMHTGVIRSDGPERRALRKKIKKETSKKMSV